jgi:hypothetical protein
MLAGGAARRRRRAEKQRRRRERERVASVSASREPLRDPPHEASCTRMRPRRVQKLGSIVSSCPFAAKSSLRTLRAAARSGRSPSLPRRRPAGRFSGLREDVGLRVLV